MNKHRMKDITHAKGWPEFFKQLRHFLHVNNFTREEEGMINHALNSFYMMGVPIEDFKEGDL